MIVFGVVQLDNIIDIIKSAKQNYVVSSKKWLNDFKVHCYKELKKYFSTFEEVKVVLNGKLFEKPVGILLVVNEQPRLYVCIDFLSRWSYNFISKIKKKLEVISKQAQDRGNKVLFILVLVTDKSRSIYMNKRSFGKLMSLKDNYQNVIDIRIIRIHLKKLPFNLPLTIKENEREKALACIERILKLAKKEIIIVDPYINSKIIEEIIKMNPNVDIIIIMGHGKKDDPKQKHQKLVTACQNYSKKYHVSIRLYSSSIIHDRWIIIDRCFVFSVGISLKDLGVRKVSVIDKIDGDARKEIISEVFEEILPKATLLFQS